jgi:hypothetical protein
MPRPSLSLTDPHDIVEQHAVSLVQGREGEDLISAPVLLPSTPRRSTASARKITRADSVRYEELNLNVPATADIVSVDLKLTSTADIGAAIRELQAEQASRTSVDTELVRIHFDHIREELKSTGPVELSLEHLELFQAYLLRRSTLQKGGDLAKEQARLLSTVVDRIKTHPLVETARSGDKLGAIDDQLGTVFKTPLRRRRQMLAMLFLNFFTGPSLLLILSLLFLWIIPYSQYICLAYVTWAVFDNSTRSMPAPSRVSQVWRHADVFKLFRNYFPIRLVKGKSAKEAKFDPNKNFLFCYHPHGVQSAGCFCMASAASGFDELFPGLRVSVQTLSINFKVPGFRENVIALGVGDASKQSITNALTKHGKGSSVALVTGGAKESMLASPFTSTVVLKDRAGFVKMALRTGAALVPVWGFGENNLYENLAVNWPFLQRWQRRIQKIISVAPLMVSGRGVFSYAGGLIPRRRPITVVFGAPIHVGKPNPNPSQEQIQKFHKEYKEAVLELFRRYRDIYDPKARDIVFV